MIWDFLLEIFFPKRCLGCGKEGFWICRDCYKQIPQEESSFVRSAPPLDGVFWAARFQGVLREAIHALKYEGVREVAAVLSELVAKRFEEAGLEFESGILVPVPLSKKREAERGFNQAVLLAEELKKRLGFEVLRGGLVKTKETFSQTGLTKEERKKNVKGSFSFVGEKKSLEKNTIFLVDDVMTTGSTLKECARVLKKAGAGTVWGLVIARD